jgi:hypothetical protein
MPSLLAPEPLEERFRSHRLSAWISSSILLIKSALP